MWVVIQLPTLLRSCCLHCQGETLQTRVAGSSEARYLSIKLYCSTAQKTVTIKSNMLPECWYLSTKSHAITSVKCKPNIYCYEIFRLRSSFGFGESSTKFLLYSSGESRSRGQVKWKGTQCLSFTVC